VARGVDPFDAGDARRRGCRHEDRHDPADGQRGRRPGQPGDRAREQSADRRGAGEDRGVDAHHAAAEDVGHGQLDDRVRRGRHRDDPPAEHDHQDERHGDGARQGHAEQRHADDGRSEHEEPQRGALAERDHQRARQRADAARRHQEAERVGAAAEHVACHERHQHLEVHAGRGHETEDRDDEQHDRRVAHVAQPLPELAADPAERALHRRAGRGEQLAGADEQQADDDRHVGRGVDEEAGGDAGHADQQPGDGRPEDPRPVEDSAVERDRIGHVLPADHLDHERLAHRHLDRAGHAQQRGHEPHVPDGDLAAEHEQPEDDCQHQRAGLRGDERAPLGQHVGDDAAEQPEGEDRQELGGGSHAKRERIVRQLEHQPPLRDLLHPRPDQRHELPEPEQPEVADAERLDAARPSGARSEWTRRRRATRGRSAGGIDGDEGRARTGGGALVGRRSPRGSGLGRRCRRHPGCEPVVDSS
jgi:hypothetical protein